MSTLLLAALWLHLAACALLVGGLFLLLLAGPPTNPAMRRWEAQAVRGLRWLVLAALAAGTVWLLARTALFEGRPGAALDARAVWNAALNTWPGLVWLARHGLLIVLGAFLLAGGEVSAARDWFAARRQAFGLAALALVLLSASGHAAAISDDRWPMLADMVHLLGAGVWVGALPPLALLLHAASRDAPTPDPYAVRAVQRFSPVALVTVLVLAGSGTVSAFLLVGDVAGLMGTAHGHLLIAKLALLVPVLLLAALNRALLHGLPGANDAGRLTTTRRMALFVGLEAALALGVLGLAAAMTVTAPGRHGDPVWPWPFRLPVESLSFAPGAEGLSLQGALLPAALGLVLLFVALLVRRRRALLIGSAFVLVAGSAAVGLPPLMVEAFPTSYRRPPIAYHAGSIAEGIAAYQARCASCHGPSAPGGERTGGAAPDLREPASRRSAGELFWLVSHGRPERGMPEFGSRLDEAERWHLINFIRASGAAGDARRIGPEIELDGAWLPAPDFTISVGPLTPTALRDHRGRRMVLLVLYSLPDSQERMAELARRYGLLSVLGVEVVAVAPQSSPDAIAELGSTPPILFPVVTDGNEEIVATYRLFAPGAAHTEFLIDRQGYIRAAWRGDGEEMPESVAVQSQVELLNEEKAPPPFPDDHVH